MLHSAWSASLADPGGVPVKPWPNADTWPVARLEVARLGIDQIVLAGASGRTLAFGPAHHGESALPGGPANTVISGHRDTHFKFLGKLDAGDEVTLTNRDGATLVYLVTQTAVVHVDDVAIELITPRRLLTMMTCYPFDALNPGTPYRYLVTAELIEKQPDRIAGQPPGWTHEPEQNGSFASGAFASVLAATGIIRRGQAMGGLSSHAGAPRWRARADNAEPLSTPREKDG